MTSDQLAAAVSTLQDRATSAGDDAKVESTPDGRIMITLANAQPGAEEAFNLRVGINQQIYLRPVINCDFDAGAPSLPSTGPARPDQEETLPFATDGLLVPCQVGPAAGTGEVFSDDAQAISIADDQWGVSVSLKPGVAGEDVWNTLAAECFNATATCPTRQLAIEVNGFIVSAPTVNQDKFAGTLQITGTFDQVAARRLADYINRGALPFLLQVDEVAQITV